MMFHAQEMKIVLTSAHIDLSATAVTGKMSMSLAQVLQISPPGETTDWLIQKMRLTITVLEFGEELKFSTELNGTKYATLTLQKTMQLLFADP